MKNGVMNDQNIKKPNRLITEKSPYLIQHAYNPVDWYPWGEEAFEKAKKENMPIFLSIGYSTCHWCHVMEKESFEDEKVAKMMNNDFVCIKVDREERPDLDSIYMAVCQGMTGSGGWPLNLILTPDKKPFFAATYIPKETKFGRPGLMELIPQIKDLWDLHRDKVDELTSQVISGLRESARASKGEIKEDILHDTYYQLLELFDEQHGGFGGSTKFPTPHNFSFLLRYWKRTGDKMALHIVERTLSAMYGGGIYDHIGFGFHRYSTDAGWLVPHFEKMLYDQALLAIVYTEAYQAIGKKEYEHIVREIFSYVLRDMTAPEGGFYSGEDADSEGEEGKFYMWTEEEIRAILDKNESELIIRVFNIDRNGNFREGRSTKRNILHMNRPLHDISLQLGMPVEELRNRLEMAREKLFYAREKRIHPGKDDKILTDWNGLMIAALAKSAVALDDRSYAVHAKRAVEFILKIMRDPEGRIYHRFRDGEGAIPAFLDDYAFLIWGLIELYEATFEACFLRSAIELNNILLTHFRDMENGGFYFTSDDAEENIIRRKEIYDGAIPSGNSVALMNLLRLGRITANPEFENIALQIAKAFSGKIMQAPSAYTQFMSALDLAFGPAFEVVIAGDLKSKETRAMLVALGKEFIPSMVMIFRPSGDEASEIIHLAEYTRNLTSLEGKATAYVCRNHACELPTTDIGKMKEMLSTFK